MLSILVIGNRTKSLSKLNSTPTLLFYLCFYLSLTPKLLVLGSPKIDPKILATLKSKTTTDVFLSFHNGTTDEIINQLKETTTNFSSFSKEEQRDIMYKALKENADKIQENVITLLSEENTRRTTEKEKILPPIKTMQLWVTNDLVVDNVDQVLLNKLMALEEISSITEDALIQLDFPKPIKHSKPFKLSDIEEKSEGQGQGQGQGQLQSVKKIHAYKLKPKQPNSGESLSWGINWIQAPALWKQGYRGEGAVVGIIDTGVSVNHECLRDNYRSYHGWFDPRNATAGAVPFDLAGHGTSVASVIVGTTRGIGVAPGAKWIACRGIKANANNVADIIACLDWMACPTDTLGNNPSGNCSQAPNVVVGSWGNVDNSPAYDEYIKKLHDNNIITVFAIGNSGPQCVSTASPANRNFTIGVGALSYFNTTYCLSSFGPSDPDPSNDNGGGVGNLKPDVLAPGERILVALSLRDDVYVEVSGTSFAAPHVAGIAALYFNYFNSSNGNGQMSIGPNGIEETFREILIKGSMPVIPSGFGRSCGNLKETTYPNYQAGYGSVDAVKFFEAVTGKTIKTFTSGADALIDQGRHLFVNVVLISIISNILFSNRGINKDIFIR